MTTPPMLAAKSLYDPPSREVWEYRYGNENHTDVSERIGASVAKLIEKKQHTEICVFGSLYLLRDFTTEVSKHLTDIANTEKTLITLRHNLNWITLYPLSDLATIHYFNTTDVLVLMDPSEERAVKAKALNRQGVVPLASEVHVYCNWL